MDMALEEASCLSLIGDVLSYIAHLSLGHVPEHTTPCVVKLDEILGTALLIVRPKPSSSHFPS